LQVERRRGSCLITTPHEEVCISEDGLTKLMNVLYDSADIYLDAVDKNRPVNGVKIFIQFVRDLRAALVGRNNIRSAEEKCDQAARQWREASSRATRARLAAHQITIVHLAMHSSGRSCDEKPRRTGRQRLRSPEAALPRAAVGHYVAKLE
jgi:hypothetical protein